MNDDIKEILDYLKDEKWDYYPSDMTPYKVFFMEERDKLLDYITNLQHTKEYLGEVLHEQDLELEDYKSRIEKAVEYNQQVIEDIKDFYRPTEDIIYSGDTLISIAEQNINILNGKE